LPIEPVPEREALPVLVLGSTGAEMPLVLEASEADNVSAIAVWVDRGLVQAWAADDGATRYRAQFLFRRWLTPAVEMRVPGQAGGAPPEFFRDGQKVLAPAVIDADGIIAYRVPLPEPRPGRSTLIEVRYQLPPGSGSITDYFPPRLRAAAFGGPLRWHVTLPPGSVPLLSAGATAETRWQWHNGLVGPGAVGSGEEWEQWMRTGEEPRGANANGSATLTAHQTTPGLLTLYRVPRAALTIICSTIVFMVCLVLTRFSAGTVGAAVAIFAGLIGVAAVFRPQTVAQVMAASQMGLFAILLVVAVQLAVRGYYLHRVTHLPGFSRGRPELAPTPTPVPGSAKIPSTSRNRPVSVGSSGAGPIAPAGG